MLYNEPPKFLLDHHAVKINSDEYYSIFIVNDNRFTVITQGTQEQAMKSAFSHCLSWLENTIDTDATFVVRSNSVTLSTITFGSLTFIDVKNIEELEEKVEIDSLDYEEVEAV